MLHYAVSLYDNWFSLFSVLCFVFYLFLVLNFFSYYCMLITISSFHGQVMVFCRSSHIDDLIDSNWCVQYGSSWVAFCCTSLRSEIMEQCILPYVSWLLTWLHSTTIFSVLLISVVRSDFSISLWENIITSENCFIKRSEFSTKMSLPQDLFLKESTYDNFRVSNSSITVFLDFGNSLLTFILNYSLHCLWLFECWALFDIDKQVRVPTSFICTEWHFINLFRRSLKCSFVISLSTDFCTKCKTFSLPHF